MIVNEIRRSKVGLVPRIFFGFLFGLIFVYSPLNRCDIVNNNDLGNYLVRIENLIKGNDTIVDDMDLLQYMSNEPLWRSILIFIGDNFKVPMDGIQLISLFSISVYAFFLIGRINFILMFIFLFNPLVVNLISGQVRSAFAMAFILLTLSVKNRIVACCMLAVISLIHTVTYMIFLVYMVSKFLESKSDKYTHKQLGLFAFAFGMTMSFVLGAGKELILGAVGDRRAEQIDDPVSITYLTYWVLMAFTLPFIAKRNNDPSKCWAEYYSIIMLLMPFFMSIFGTDGTRFLALNFTIILYAISTYTLRVRIAMMSCLFFYEIVQYWYWIQNMN
jgi:hypothetical protein